ncbi:flagellar protein FlgN [Gammaproteobacteria bacterium]|jgi:flagellar biosynthesis/type III secretory pathway chaperone|nr:flagellar protein FlgN [Gammaproteobacteria bacterium]MDB3890758.1 flagellar protein FlgN [Gammaproteobacteria bacterium]MDB4165902.1 flagellar protein FlgN [Gammaproteobacteria bacterium]MDB9758912.1 flagellar protein FlgN [Gammaproteobacteria bacterium]MDC1358097.1 flagellar protein FlgN [Gammaproteobacteria bacterium]
MADLNEALFKISALEEILEREFSLLKTQDFESFEALQERKNELLSFLADNNEIDDKPHDVDTQAILSNENLSTKLQHCRDMQQRNEVLVRQKLSSIREALQTLQTGGDTRSNTYEHLGKGRR